MSQEEFLKLLETHDWFYMYSDDHRYYTKGSDESARIQAIMKDDKELQEVYKNYVEERGL